MNAKRFKTLNGFWTNVSPVKEGKKQHNYAEGLIQTGTDKEEKVLFFFQKPNTTNTAYENALTAFRSKQSTIISSLTEDSEGKFLTSRISEVKPKPVTFERRKSVNEQTTDFSTITNTGSSSNEDTVTLIGSVVKLEHQVNIKKFDNLLQKRIDKRYKTGILANQSGAVLIMLWQNLADEIKEDDYVTLRYMRRSVDANGNTYFTSTFKTEWTSATNESNFFDEEAISELLTINLNLFKTISCTVDSILIETISFCPRCKTKSNSTESVAICSNILCAATFRTKNKSVKFDLTVTEIDTQEQHQVIGYKDILLNLIGDKDKNEIIHYFMGNDNKFNLTFHWRSKIIEKIESLQSKKRQFELFDEQNRYKYREPIEQFPEKIEQLLDVS